LIGKDTIQEANLCSQNEKALPLRRFYKVCPFVISHTQNRVPLPTSGRKTIFDLTELVTKQPACYLQQQF
jgi:hypothetical protein